MLTFGIVTLFCSVSFAANVSAPELFRWSLPEQAIDDVRFSQDARWITFIAQMAIPDGHEAEEYDEAFGEGWMSLLEQRAKTEPRFQDPVIRVLDAAGHAVCEVPYGWNPDVRGPGPEVVFSFQVRPITNMRRLADTLQGNTIQFFDCTSHLKKALASPKSGYLDTPRFVGEHIYFTQNERVNGDYGGPIGLSEVSLNAGAIHDIVAPRRKEQFFYLLSDLETTNTLVRYTISEPKPAPGDEYMASDYALVRYERDDTAGRTRPMPLPKPLGPERPDGEQVARVASPDGKFVLMEEPHPETDATQVGIWRANGRKPLARIDPKGVIRGMYWSPDGSRIAIVCTKIGDFSGPGVGKFHFLHDEIVVYRWQPGS